MKRLNTHPLYDSALNCLHRIEALYSAYNVDYKLGFTFGSIPRLLTLGCREVRRTPHSRIYTDQTGTG